MRRSTRVKSYSKSLEINRIAKVISRLGEELSHFAHEDTNFDVEKTAECSFSQLFWSKACKIGEYCLLLHCV